MCRKAPANESLQPTAARLTAFRGVSAAAAELVRPATRGGAGVIEAQRELPKRWRIGRVLVIYCVAGLVLGCFLGMIQRMTGLPSAVAVGLVGGLLVLVAPVLNWLVRSGKAPWLLKE